MLASKWKTLAKSKEVVYLDPMSDPSPESIDRVREFSRFYTERIGLLDDVILDSRFTLPEARVLFEIAICNGASQGDVALALGLDGGYVSRLVSGLEGQGIVARERAPDDGRRMLLALTEAGAEAYAELRAASRGQVSRLLAPLSAEDRERVVQAMDLIRQTIGAPEGTRRSSTQDASAAPTLETRRAPVVLRPPRPGDLGWIVQRHGELYHDLRGWNADFEALVAELVADFVRDEDPTCERCWIADDDGQRVGSIFLVRHDDVTGQLRMLFVEPHARGRGVGRMLVHECVEHARRVGYRRMVLYTSKGLEAARRLYELEGFRLSRETPTHEWGHDHVEQWWELDL